MDKTSIKRFNEKLDKTNDCWLWLGSKSSFGYGLFFLKGKQVKAHRVSYQINLGEIAEGKLVLHKCDTASCVRPSHLYLGSHWDNTKDMMKRGRWIGPIKGGR